MIWGDLFAAIALVLIIEGAIPCLAPRWYRRSLSRLDQLSEGNLRLIGLALIIGGALLLSIVR